MGQIAKQLGDAWKLMIGDQKETYELSAKADKTRYEHDMELYKKGQFVPVNQEDVDETDEDDDDN